MKEEKKMRSLFFTLALAFLNTINAFSSETLPALQNDLIYAYVEQAAKLKLSF